MKRVRPVEVPPRPPKIKTFATFPYIHLMRKKISHKIKFFRLFVSSNIILLLSYLHSKKLTKELNIYTKEKMIFIFLLYSLGFLRKFLIGFLGGLKMTKKIFFLCFFGILNAFNDVRKELCVIFMDIVLE